MTGTVRPVNFHAYEARGKPQSKFLNRPMSDEWGAAVGQGGLPGEPLMCHRFPKVLSLGENACVCVIWGFLGDPELRHRRRMVVL